MPKIYWSIPMERTIQDDAFRNFLTIAMRAGANSYTFIGVPYLRVDVARNNIVNTFLENSTDEEDVLIMLDADHMHPRDILERLAAHSVGVVGALAFKRGEPYDPCFFYRGDDGGLHAAAEWEGDAGLVPCTVVGTGAIAIRRWVFSKLDAEGYPWPYFQCSYPDGTHKTLPSEDMFFGIACEQAGIPHHVDLSLCTPHLVQSCVDQSSFEQYRADHPIRIMPVPVLKGTP
jgi:hypothetical protein